MLSDHERSALLDALRDWAKTEPDKRSIGFFESSDLLTPLELVNAVEESSKPGLAFLEIIEHSIRRDGISTVVGKFRSKLGS